MTSIDKDVLIASLMRRLESVQPGSSKTIFDEIKYWNYITEEEYNKVVPELKNHDGTKGPKLTVETMKSMIGKTNGAWLNMEPYYNDWALMLEINHIMSTSSKFIYEVSSKTGIPSVLICYDLACGMLKDKNNPRWLRDFFDLEKED
jgi:hypothetical protein